MAYSVITYGADPTGVADSRAAFQSAIDAAFADPVDKLVTAPAGTFRFTANPSDSCCINLKAGVTLQGAGPEKYPRVVTVSGTGPDFSVAEAAPRASDNPSPTILQLTAGIAPARRLIRITGAGGAIKMLTLDGNRATQTVNEHRHGTFAQNASNFLIEDVESRNFTGDGFYEYINTSNSVQRRVYAHDNGRNGTTWGATNNTSLLEDSEYSGCDAQQVDSEPVKDPNIVQNIEVRRCLLDGLGTAGVYSLTISGTSSINHGRNWWVHHNIINGPIFVVWVEDVLLEDNFGVNPKSSPFLDVNRSSRRITVLRNNFRQANTTSFTYAFKLTATAGAQPSLIDIGYNRIKVDMAASYGIHARGATNVDIFNNTIVGAGASSAGAAGVYLRPTILTRPMIVARVANNTVQNFGQYGLSITGNSTAELLWLQCTSNVFENVEGSTSQSVGMSLNDATNCLQAGVVAGNTFGAGVVTDITNIPPGADLSFEMPTGGAARFGTSWE